MIGFKSNKATLSDLCYFFRIIRRYHKAGLTLQESINEYLKSIDKPILKNIAGTVNRDMKNGLKFSEALTKHPTFFPSFIVELIKVGESSGKIGQFLDEIVFYLEQDIEIKRELKSALFMPKMFLGGMFIAFMIGVLFVIPKLGELLSDAHLELPLITRIVIGISTTAQSFWYIFVFLAAVIFFGYKYLKKQYPEYMEALSLRIPFFKVINYNYMQYNFAKIFGLCITSGIQTSKALRYTAVASGNIVMKNVLENAAVAIENGGVQVSEAIKKADTFGIVNKNFYTMLAVGTTAGKIGDIMLSESENYKKEMMIALKLIGDKIGLCVSVPGYICLIGLFASIEFPVLTMMQNIGNVGGTGM